jgi:type II secretory pathway predicted ATPase ExeA
MIATQSFLRDIPVQDMLSIPQQNEGFARLRYTISSKGLGVVTATPGMGKSTLIRQLESNLDKSKFLLCYINDAELKPKTLYAHLLNALAVQPPAFIDKMKKQFREAVLNLYHSHDRLLVIIIDNAHELPMQTLREFRYMLNFDMDSRSLLSLLLIGHPELWDTLRLRSFEALYQCVTTHYRMSPLNEAQTKEYIVHQLKLSNAPMNFPDDIVKRICQFTSGIPRVINNICRHCLIDMESNKLELVDNDVLERVLNEFRN